MPSIRDRITVFVDSLPVRLASRDSVLAFSLLGVLTGLVVGLLIALFHATIMLVQERMLGGQSDDFESLPEHWYLLLPALGALAIGLVLQVLSKEDRKLGIVHVYERLATHQGRMRWRNAVLEFFASGSALITGQSVGRESPGVHLGAAAGSLLGQRLRLPHNALRMLVACGSAAAIGGFFNTPLAGVIFAMEVILMEYSMLGFAPVMLAAVISTSINRAIFGTDLAFDVPTLGLGSLWELPWLLFVGLALGVLSSGFCKLIVTLAKFSKRHPIWLMVTSSGVITGLCALQFPQVLGIGYDTVDAALSGQLALTVLLGVCLFKFIASACAAGLGMPGGFIGPTLFIGATAGAALGVLGETIAPDQASNPTLYAIVGMGTMMAATFQAPLAALMALLELTGNPHMILPAMLAVVTGVLTQRSLFGQDSVLLQRLRIDGLDYRNDPISQSLRSIGVAGIMQSDLVTLPRECPFEQARRYVGQTPRWVVIDVEEPLQTVLPGADLARFLEKHPDREGVLDLKEMPAQRQQTVAVSDRASLQEAFEALSQHDVEAVLVTAYNGHPRGILTRADIESSYRQNPSRNLPGT